MTAPVLPSERAIRYAEQVRKGKIPAPEAVKLACDRYIWLTRGDEFLYDPDNLNARAEFIEMLDTPESNSPEMDPLYLLDYQCLTLGYLYAILQKDGHRAIKRFFLFIPRKAGKSTLAAGLMAVEGASPVGGARNLEILAAGVNLETANHSFGKLVKMLDTDQKKGGGFCEMFGAKVLKDSVHFAESGATVKKVSAGAKSMEGFVAGAVFFDEISRLPTPSAINTLFTGLGHTPHRLLFCTSTCSDLPESALDTEKELVLNTLRAPKKKAIICGLLYYAEAKDDWRSPKTWAKVNPRLRDSKSDALAHYREMVELAKDDEIMREDFLLRGLNVDFGGGAKWLNKLEYDAVDRIPADEMWPPAKHALKKHYIGIDLGDSRDCSSLCIMSVGKDDVWELRWFIFYPDGSGEWVDDSEHLIATLYSGGIHKKYMRLAKKGHATICSGPLVNHKMIADKIKQIAKEIKVLGLYSDPYHGLEQLRMCLPEELNGRLIGVPKTIATQSPAVRALESRIKMGGLRIDPNPIVRDHFLNAIAKHTESDGVMLRKATKTSLAHIDSCDAALNCIIGRAYVSAKEQFVGTPVRPIENPDQYEVRDFILEL